ncbi:DUF1016 N-terminal domain-containing protein [Desmonostoc muscorum LEGE 12446]|uniref:YhcG N-terminal domain-containing protein n=1 Tax=Desmonostoc muscorum LEGE 12446 TaxID=1828758 RepID=A0A8J7AFB5_DESMC|nr:DUF1016 N-terminal domain-containing protein [Desmonostoc muscorum]MCF2147220.1 DUF1016 N-terminal domain-containing protein [Desmonostoc muscorum LEGE 12446]
MINGYENTLTDLIQLLESSRRAAARSVNAIMTATYWEIGRRIVELEQGGEKRAEYGAAVIKRLSEDLTGRFGKGFSKTNLEQMRRFYLQWQIAQAPSGKLDLSALAQGFPLPWSHYVRLLSVQDLKARQFYEIGSITKFQLQIDSFHDFGVRLLLK